MKTDNLGFQTGPRRIGIYIHRRMLETRNFEFKKEMDCSIRVAFTQQLIRGIKVCYLLSFKNVCVCKRHCFNRPFLLINLKIIYHSYLIYVFKRNQDNTCNK